VTPPRIRRALESIDSQTVLFVFVLATVFFLVVYPMILVILNSFQIAPPGRPRVFGWDGWRVALSEPSMRGSVYNTLTLLFVRQAIAFPIAIFGRGSSREPMFRGAVF
jgi:iron(III) transport system permease protein